jgi:hypothetical protein
MPMKMNSQTSHRRRPYKIHTLVLKAFNTEKKWNVLGEYLTIRTRSTVAITTVDVDP